jgi:hypothetical protein
MYPSMVFFAFPAVNIGLQTSVKCLFVESRIDRGNIQIVGARNVTVDGYVYIQPFKIRYGILKIPVNTHHVPWQIGKLDVFRFCVFPHAGNFCLCLFLTQCL